MRLNHFRQSILFLTLLPGLLMALPQDPVELNSGKVSGVALDSGVQVYRGIPFAAPPVNDLRWKAPQPPVPWEGVLTADEFGPVCMQQRSEALMSEDCLYLNVWTKAASAASALPVMVWIHGGGWTSGSSSGATYDGEAFANNDVVLVSVNYRMSALGFMAHPALSAENENGVSGNYGILDHIAALEGVRDNHAGFGGDPDNVTIFVESAGGASIYALLATPLAKGLFHRAISESTWIHATNVTNLESANGMTDSAESRGEQAVNARLQELGLGGAGTLAAMRDLSARDVLGMDYNVSLTVDGWAYPESPAEIFANGQHNVVPLMAGVNDGEGLFFVRPDRIFANVEEQRQARTVEFGEYAGRLLDYYVGDSDTGIFDVEVAYNTDSWFARPTREILEANTRASAPAFMYVFTRNLRDPAQMAPHAMELRYVFNTLPADAPQPDQDLSALMNDYWTRFAATGNPNGEGLPRWPDYELEQQTHQILGVDVGQGTGFHRPELDELDRYFKERYDSAR